jgi:flagellar basal-body rod modification protein FlgD
MSAISGLGGTSSDIRTDYLKLLVAQLSNQNPLEPLSNNEMASQLAQLSQLERLEDISSTFEKVFQGAQLSQARELVGKIVSFVPAGKNTEYWGKVDRVDLADGEPRLWVGNYALSPSEVKSVLDTQFSNDPLMEQFIRASALVGKEVVFPVTDADGVETQQQGRVDSVEISDGRVLLNVGGQAVDLGEILRILN